MSIKVWIVLLITRPAVAVTSTAGISDSSGLKGIDPSYNQRSETAQRLKPTFLKTNPFLSFKDGEKISSNPALFLDRSGRCFTWAVGVRRDSPLNLTKNFQLSC